MEPSQPEPPQETEPLAAPKRSSGGIALLVFLAIGGSAVGVMIYQSMQGKAKPGYDTSGFDISKVDAPPPPKPVAAAPAAQAPASAPVQAVAVARPAPVAEKPLSARGAREKQFVDNYGKALRQYQGRLTRIADSAYRKYPVVREVDHDFGQLDRYMAVKRRFEQDNNPFNFARDAIALPEVRKTISKYLADPRAYTAAMSMMTQTVKEEPPPKEVYGAAKDFMVNDPSMTHYMDDFIKEIMGNTPAMIQGVSPDTDTSAIAGIMKDVAPGAPLPTSASIPAGVQLPPGAAPSGH